MNLNTKDDEKKLKKELVVTMALRFSILREERIIILFK
jgi:hypothetical protein